MGGFDMNGLFSGGGSGSGNGSGGDRDEGGSRAPGMGRKTQLIIVAVIIIACVLSLKTGLKSAVDANGCCADGLLICYVSAEDAGKIAPGQTAQVNGRQFPVESVASQPMTRDQVAEKFPGEQALAALEPGDENYEVAISAGDGLADGFYAVSISLG